MIGVCLFSRGPTHDHGPPAQLKLVGWTKTGEGAFCGKFAPTQGANPASCQSLIRYENADDDNRTTVFDTRTGPVWHCGWASRHAKRRRIAQIQTALVSPGEISKTLVEC